jgi:hypothetical protein
MNMARSMLREKNLSNDYWDEVVACSVYILNRSPTTSVKDKVPQEAWSGTKLNVSHFKIFGCIAFAHIPEELRKKLDNRSEKCIFIGYSEQSKAYRLYNPVTKKFLVSRDVKFLENKSWSEQENVTLDSQNPLHQIDEQTENSEQQAHPPRLPRLQVQRQQEHSGNGSSSSSESSSSVENQRTRSIREIYEQNNDIEQQSHFSLLSCQPTYFEEAVKEEHWVQAMNEEIEAIERKQDLGSC